jgi:hypothetical protein
MNSTFDIAAHTSRPTLRNVGNVTDNPSHSLKLEIFAVLKKTPADVSTEFKDSAVSGHDMAKVIQNRVIVAIESKCNTNPR